MSKNATHKVSAVFEGLISKYAISFFVQIVKLKKKKVSHTDTDFTIYY